MTEQEQLKRLEKLSRDAINMLCVGEPYPCDKVMAWWTEFFAHKIPSTHGETLSTANLLYKVWAHAASFSNSWCYCAVGMHKPNIAEGLQFAGRNDIQDQHDLDQMFKKDDRSDIRTLYDHGSWFNTDIANENWEEAKKQWDTILAINCEDKYIPRSLVNVDIL